MMQAACDLGAPVVELHTGRYCEAVAARRRGAGLAPSSPRLREAAEQGPRDRARGPCRPRARFRHRPHGRRDPADRRTQHRPFHRSARRCSSASTRSVRTMRAAIDAGRAEAALAMILGIGSDLCDIRRIERSLERFGERFTHRIFTQGERARSDRRAARAPPMRGASPPRRPAPRLSARACGRGVFWRDMEVVNLPTAGRPCGSAAAPGAPAGHDAARARGRGARVPHRRSAPGSGLRGHRSAAVRRIK